MDESSGAPIRAQVFDDDALARLETFVAGLGERIDAIQDAERAGLLEEVAKRTAELGAEAQGLGLPPLARAAEGVVASCSPGRGAALHAEIVQLTDVIRRVRLGHRGGLT